MMNELHILSIVRRNPSHGYAIVAQMRTRAGGRGISVASIYRLVADMEKRGLLEGTLEPAPGQGPPRKTYRLTDRGRDHLVRAALSCLSGPTEERSSIETALENIRLINPHTALAALGLYAESLEAERAEKGPAEDDPDLEAVVLAERRRRRIAAEIGFVEWLSATIRDHLDDEGRGWKR